MKDLFKKLIPKKKSQKALIITAGIFLFIASGYYFLGNQFSVITWGFSLVLFSVVFLVIWSIAGFDIMKALFFTAAEISLLIFLAQAYCDSPKLFPGGDEALKTLLFLGILYIVIRFGKKLTCAMQGRYQLISKEKWSGEKVGVIAIFLFSMSILIWQISIVIAPIVLNLCVYN